MWKITLYMDYPYSRNKKEGKEMIYEINQERLLKTLQELIETPSVVGYYPCIHQLLEELVEPYGLTVDYDRRHTAYVKISGQNPEKRFAWEHTSIRLEWLSVQSKRMDGFLSAIWED